MVGVTPYHFYLSMESLEEKYKQAMEKPLRVLEIFNDFFSEERVDMQGFPTFEEIEEKAVGDISAANIKTYISQQTKVNKGFILVHFPHVRVTNEYDRYVDINHLFAKVPIDVEGRIYGKFLLNRSEYTMLHITNNYMHSHISYIPTDNLESFQLPCTGSGPINNTICSLARDFDEDLWKLFCLEMDKFVQVESVSGVPYHRLESLVEGGMRNVSEIGTSLYLRSSVYTLPIHNNFSIAYLADFTKYLIDSNILKFTYATNEYALAMSPVETIIKVSNCFIKWYNKKFDKGEIQIPYNRLLSKGILCSCIFSNDKLFRPYGRSTLDFTSLIGKKVCVFKGNVITLNITDAPIERNDNQVVILDVRVIEYILTKILNVINYRYGNTRNKDNSSTSSTSEKIHFL